MGLFSSLFSSKKPFAYPVKTDMHSHLLPGIDDGAQSIEDTLILVQEFEKLGLKKAILSPHIIDDCYKNSPENILPLLENIKKTLKEHGFQLELEAAAEYFVDEFFLEKIETDQPLLTFGKDKYILIETSFMNRPGILENVIFKLLTKGMKPIFAHPERYIYLYENFEDYKELKDKGLYFQINLMSLSGYYSTKAKKIAEKLIDHNMVDFIGTDCHHTKHIEAIQASLSSKYIEKLNNLNLLNDTL